MSNKARKKNNKSKFADKVWAILSIFAGIGFAIFLVWTIYDAFSYGFADECDVKKPEITNCYRFTDASVVEVDKYASGGKRKKIGIKFQTDSGEEIRTYLRFIEFGKSFQPNDEVKIEVWNERIINVEKAREKYPTDDNPSFDLSNMYFLDILAIVVVFLSFVGIIIIPLWIAYK